MRQQDAPRPLICIFAKAPVAGAVKTRLAAGIGEAAALRVYERLLTRTIARLDCADWRVELWVTPDRSAAIDGYWPADLARVGQRGGDLGARMARALGRASNGRPVIVVGTDIPGLWAHHIDAALRALADTRLVFGPSLDGGFYLVGLRGAAPAGLFRGVPWSAPDTLARAVESCGPLASAMIETLDDLDDLASLSRHRDDPDWCGLADPEDQTLP